MEGTVVWYDVARGYGFIEPTQDGGDIVFGPAALTSAFGESGPRPGDTVCYEATDGEQGPEATDVKPAGEVP
jgi:cold shock CspA family protein